MSNLKAFLHEFPTQGAASFTGVCLVFLTGVVVAVKLALGQPFPTGYDAWLIFLGTLAGVNMVGMVGKRATSVEYRAAKHPPGPTTEVNADAAVVVTAPSKEADSPPITEAGIRRTVERHGAEVEARRRAQESEDTGIV